MRSHASLNQTSTLHEVATTTTTSVADSTDSDSTQHTKRQPIYWAVKTNLLYHAAIVPNLGVELYVGERWSIAADYLSAWWSNHGTDKFWRIYGGEVEFRHWVGRKSEGSPLKGHHIGLYGQLLTYDITFNGRGYLGDSGIYGGGISYGYSLPIGQRLNLDFSLGFGYLGGEYKEYLPIEGHYVWQATKHLHFWGPTKAEVTLVWMLGREHRNPQKGGRR